MKLWNGQDLSLAHIAVLYYLIYKGTVHYIVVGDQLWGEEIEECLVIN